MNTLSVKEKPLQSNLSFNLSNFNNSKSTPTTGIVFIDPVAASNNLTGSAALGGDWELEVMATTIWKDLLGIFWKEVLVTIL